MSMTLDDINKLLEHSFKDESLRNEVWKDFYAILPAPIGIGFDDDVLEFLDGAWKLNQKTIFIVLEQDDAKACYKKLQTICPITRDSLFIGRTCGHILDLERPKAFHRFVETYIEKKNIKSLWVRIEDDSHPIGDKFIRMISVYK